MKKGNNPEQIVRYMALKEVYIVINASDVEEEMTTKEFLDDIESHCYESDLLAPSLEHEDTVGVFDNDGNWLENYSRCPNCRGALDCHLNRSQATHGALHVSVECCRCFRKWEAELLPGEFEVVK